MITSISFRCGVFLGGAMLCAAPLLAQPAEPVANEKIVFYHADHLGSTNVVTNSQGKLVSEFVYYPYGHIRHGHHAGAHFDPHYLFAGSERDEESGLQSMGARFYAAGVGRFASFDNWAGKVEVTGAYAYARNNPLRYVDPHGMEPTESSEDSSESATDPEPVGAIVKDTVAAVPGVIQTTNQKAGGIAASKAAAMNDPDPAKRNEAGEAFADEVGSAAGTAGAEKAWDVVDENTGWAFKVPLIIGYAGLAIGLAFDDTDLPVPIPAITFGVGGGTVSLTPSLDLSPITVAGEDSQQYVYVPGMGLGLSYSTGVFSQSVGGSFTPGPDGVAGVTGSAGFGVNAGPVSFGASASGTPDKSYSVSGSLTIKAP